MVSGKVQRETSAIREASQQFRSPPTKTTSCQSWRRMSERSSGNRRKIRRRARN